MSRLNRATIIPVSSEQASALEKWTLPDVQAAKAKVVELSAHGKQLKPVDNLSNNADADGFSSSTEGKVNAAFEKGYQDGLRVAEQQYKKKQQQLDALLRTLAQPVQSLGDQVAQELVSLAIEIARSIIKREVKLKPAVFSELVASAMTSLPDGEEPAKVILHPEDRKLLSEHASSALDQYNLQWEEVENTSRGSFQIVQSDSVIDGGIEAMLQTVSEQLDVDDDQ